jgi:outer membrane protein OmpA-like peptidoglycan-associated protein
MKKIFIPIVLFIGISLSAFAQEKSSKEKRGDKYFTKYAFDKAIDTYTHTKNLTTEGQRRLAVSLHNLNQSTESEIAYSKLVSETSGVLPEDHYNYAMILKANGKYDQSNAEMDKFSALKPADLRVKSYLSGRSGFAELLKDQGKYKIVHLDVNTDAEDFGTSYFKNKIVFASSRERPKFVKRRYNWNNQPFLDMYVSEVEKGQLKKPVNFDKSLNRKMHDGPATFSNDGNFMAFTRNDYDTKKKDKIVELQICFSSFKDGKWSAPEPFMQNNKEYSVGQPCLTADGNTMYFVSDMPGGFGGADLYRSTKNGKGEWSKAENLGDKINTEGDEMFPFYEESNEVLFFSSNGRFGLGGLDVFACATNGSAFGTVVNAGAPLNTASDDFAAIIDSKMASGYVSSNRAGGSGDDDIYSYDLLKDLGIGKKIKGIAKDKAGAAIPQTFVTLLDENGKTIDTLTTKMEGKYVFLVDSDKKYKLTGKKKGYMEGDTSVSTAGKNFIVPADLTLLKKDEMVAQKIQVGADLGKIVKQEPYDPAKSNIHPDAEVAYFDLDKYNIRPDAEAEMDKIVKVMNEYPGMVIELGSYTDCRATKEYNQVLSEKRAQASIDYIKKRITKPSRISGKGFGEDKPVNGCACEGDVVSNCSEAEHQKNRRTEFIIKKK